MTKRTALNQVPTWSCLILLIAWTSWTGCARLRIVTSDRVVYPVAAGKPFTPAIDGVFMSTALYQRTQKAVADKILELQTTPK